jgi:hypothetical protein
MDSLGPVVLSVAIRDDNLRRSGERGRGRGPRAAMMDNGSDARKEGVHIHLADGEAVGLVLHQ